MCELYMLVEGLGWGIDGEGADAGRRDYAFFFSYTQPKQDAQVLSMWWVESEKTTVSQWLD